MSYFVARTIDDALKLVSTVDDAALIAGGTDVMVAKEERRNHSRSLVDISRIDEMRRIAVSDDIVAIGAAVTLEDIIGSADLQARFPVLATATRSIASPTVRATATIAGNLLCENRCVYFNHSHEWRQAIGKCLKCDGDVCIATGGSKSCFAVCISDLAPTLIALDARVEFVSANGISTCSIEDLYSGDGVSPRALPRNAIVTQIVLPAVGAGRVYFRKLRPRRTIDFTNLTVVMRRVGDIVVAAATGVGAAPAVVRVPTALGHEAVASSLQAATQIINNVAYARAYRRSMLDQFVQEGWSFINDM